MVAAKCSQCGAPIEVDSGVPIYGSSAHGNLRLVALMPGDILQQILRVLFFRLRAEYFGRFFEYVDFYRIRQTHFFRHAPDAVVLIRIVRFTAQCSSDRTAQPCGTWGVVKKVAVVVVGLGILAFIICFVVSAVTTL